MATSSSSRSSPSPVMCGVADRLRARPPKRLARRRGRMRGTTLVEVILFMLIVSIAVVSVGKARSQPVLWPADPLVQRQTLAIAESLTGEIDSQPYAQKDP